MLRNSRQIEPRLFPSGGFGAPAVRPPRRHSQRHVASSRLARRKNPSVLLVPGIAKHYTSGLQDSVRQPRLQELLSAPRPQHSLCTQSPQERAPRTLTSLSHRRGPVSKFRNRNPDVQYRGDHPPPHTEMRHKTTKPQHPRGFQSIFAPKPAPMLEFQKPNTPSSQRRLGPSPGGQRPDSPP